MRNLQTGGARGQLPSDSRQGTNPPVGPVSRRTALLLGAGGLAAALAVRAPAPITAQDRPTTFVLVHGAWAGAWIWRKVIPLLREAGHDVYATTATGMGDRAHLADPAIDLDVYITDVVNVLEFEDLRGVALVGHSYGGMIITGVAERVPERLARLVYLDALVPADGENDYDVGFASEAAREAALIAEVAAGLAADVPGFRPVTPDVEEWLRAMTRDPADADWLLSKLVPQPIATSTQRVRLGNPAAAALPRAFIHCTEETGTADEDPFVRIAERVRSDPDWTYREVAANHLVLVNDPRATAKVLLSLV